MKHQPNKGYTRLDNTLVKSVRYLMKTVTYMYCIYM